MNENNRLLLIPQMEVLDEFSDVTPIFESENADKICKIRYVPNFREYIGILRACILSGELSDRVFRLTTNIIMMNTGFISAWLVRQQCILKNGVNFEEEFAFLDQIRNINEKCYQTWMHRQFLVDVSNRYENEKDYCESYICLDNKNIHSWTYRYWVVQKFNLWENELEYTEKYIDLDIFNNSAWSYRYYVFTHETRSSEAIDAEIEYVVKIIEQAPHNDAAWNYLKGFLKAYPKHSFADVEVMVKRILEQNETVNALDFLISLHRSSYSVEKCDESIAYAKRLQELDYVRKLYWERMEEKLIKEKEYLMFINE